MSKIREIKKAVSAQVYGARLLLDAATSAMEYFDEFEDSREELEEIKKQLADIQNNVEATQE